MPKFGPDKIRTLALIGHGGSGKTSLAEAILFDTGVIGRMGKTDDGTTRTDYDPDEISRHISINAVPIAVEWSDVELNIVDCPGYVDFLPEVNVVMQDMDAAAIVVNATAGCEPQTEKAWNSCKHYELPAVCFFSKMDKDNADFEKVLEDLKKNLDGTFVPLAVPIGAAATFKGYVDLLTKKAYTFSDESGKATEGPVDASMERIVQKYREALLEAAAGADDSLIEKYLNGEELTDAEIFQGLRAGVLQRKLVPVIPGSGLKNAGIQALLDMMVRFLPSPADRKVVVPVAGKDDTVQVSSNAGDEVLARVFKVLVEPHVGELCIVRVYSGTLSSGMVVANATRDEKEKIGAILRLRGKDRVDAQDLGPGQIGALLKLRTLRWGDTVASDRRMLRFPDPKIPDPYMSVALHPATAQDTEKLSNALSKLRAEDPFIKAEMNEVTREFVVSGTGELHVDNFVRRLRDRYKINVETGKPKIPYRETVRGKGEGQGKHKKQSGGHGQFGDCHLRIEPNPTGAGFEFVDAIVGGKIPNRFIPAVEKGVREALVRGILAGYPVTDLKVTVFDGSYHAVDSSEMAFKTAASKGFKKVALMAKPIIQEPVMNVEVVVPEANMGDIMGDLNSRRGRILGMEPDGRKQIIKAQVPLGELYKYIITLRSITGGRGEYTMTLSHYEEVPAHVAEQIIKDAGVVEEEED
ncbi:MAG: elongation factor G [Candidatus Riflebacteria bacterium]|nr:elongation factor G [Candidatus Riflebacteria bacterium]